MPELPEVETTRQGIAPHIQGKKINRVIIRNRRLRWPVTPRLEGFLTGQTIHAIHRRAKYLLFETARGTMILHLGMSGSLRIVGKGDAIKKHDHAEWQFNHGKILRFNDPRRFGSIHWTSCPASRHKLLAPLGPEPLEDAFDGEYLFRQSRARKIAIKNFIMNSHVVVGVGNIYASESLYLAGIHPKRAAHRISKQRYEKLACDIKQVLNAAIESGGSTLNDFIKPDGEPGYFQHHFRVYGKAGEPCESCGGPIRQITLGQRSTFFCPNCQS